MKTLLKNAVGSMLAVVLLLLILCGGISLDWVPGAITAEAAEKK